MKFFRKYDLHLVFGGAFVLAFGLMLFDNSRSLGVNLFTEITGVAVTVFLINKILERRERKKRISIDGRILREVQSIIASYFSIWKHLAWQYLPKEKVESQMHWQELYPKLVSISRMEDKFEVVSIHHPESWKLFFHNKTIKECFENYYNTLNDEIRLLINDFKMYLEPELLDCLLNIMESQYFKNIFMISQDGTKVILDDLGEDINRLDSYLSPDESTHLNLFFELMEYSKRLKTTISKFDGKVVELYQIKKYFIHPSQFA